MPATRSRPWRSCDRTSRRIRTAGSIGQPGRSDSRKAGQPAATADARPSSRASSRLCAASSSRFQAAATSSIATTSPTLPTSHMTTAAFCWSSSALHPNGLPTAAYVAYRGVEAEVDREREERHRRHRQEQRQQPDGVSDGVGAGVDAHDRPPVHERGTHPQAVLQRVPWRRPQREVEQPRRMHEHRHADEQRPPHDRVRQERRERRAESPADRAARARRARAERQRDRRAQRQQGRRQEREHHVLGHVHGEGPVGDGVDRADERRRQREQPRGERHGSLHRPAATGAAHTDHTRRVERGRAEDRHQRDRHGPMLPDDGPADDCEPGRRPPRELTLTLAPSNH